MRSVAPRRSAPTERRVPRTPRNGAIRELVAFVSIAFMACPLWAQGFAGLGQGGDGFALPTPDPTFTFPADHGAHPEYRIEWWYLTATLKGDDGRDYGIQWTLFRSALSPKGPQIWMGHAGLTTPEAHYGAERFSRDDIGQAGVIAEPFAAWIDDWRMESLGLPAAPVGTADQPPTLPPGGGFAPPRAGGWSPNSENNDDDALNRLKLTARLNEARYELTLDAQGPLVFHGENGFSVKSESGQASYYYSQPFYTVTGTLHLPSGSVKVSGQGWLDREWSSQPLEADQEGWDWFSLHFENGHRLMGFGLRGQARTFTYASWITPDGRLTPYNSLELTPLGITEVAGRDVPTHWRLVLPEEGLNIESRAINPQSWQPTLFPYWEGPVIATGSHRGRGYLEMTGYD